MEWMRMWKETAVSLIISTLSIRVARQIYAVYICRPRDLLKVLEFYSLQKHYTVSRQGIFLWFCVVPEDRLLLNYKGSSFRQPEADLHSLLCEGLPSQPLCDCISPLSLLGSELLRLLHYWLSESNAEQTSTFAFQKVLTLPDSTWRNYGRFLLFILVPCNSLRLACSCSVLYFWPW